MEGLVPSFSFIKERHDYENKPYVGIIIYEMIKKEELHENDIYSSMPNGQIKKLLSVVYFRKAIPVPNGVYYEIDIRKHKDRDLLAKEYEFCNRKKETILSKCKSMIKYQKKTGIVLFAYCDYNLLEEKMSSYFCFESHMING